MNLREPNSRDKGILLTKVILVDDVYDRQMERREWIRLMLLDMMSDAIDKCNDELLDLFPDNFISNKRKMKANKKSAKRQRATNPKIFKEKSQLANVPNKYWAQRYRFWSLYDKGIKMDAEGWYSVSPELISRHTAERCRFDVIVDAFAGCGGNAIQFALTSHFVIAIDIDPVKIDAARHNACIYGVQDRIEFILGDAMKILPKINGKADLVFLSPPWGGPDYINATTFDLSTMLTPPLNGLEIFKAAKIAAKNIVYFLPRNCSLPQIFNMARDEGFLHCEIESQYMQHGKLKAKTAYFGEDIVGNSEVNTCEGFFQANEERNTYGQVSQENDIYAEWVSAISTLKNR